MASLYTLRSLGLLRSVSTRSSAFWKPVTITSAINLRNLSNYSKLQAESTPVSDTPVIPYDDSSQSASPPSPQPTEKLESNDWLSSFYGMSTEAFPGEISDVLMRDLEVDDIEIKPDGILYLPEIKYRRILNKAFGPGGWGLAPRGETFVSPKLVTREYALLCHGRVVSVARGEQEYFDPNNVATATEGCKSNALMRCCKDLGIASELWDPRFIRKFKKEQCVEQFVEHVVTKKKRKLWRRKDQTWEYPYKLATF
ncbi:mitochondrial genome maintenance MGM101-domain-containing protein [Lipomyces arxii]|uniref:mitochondrial genome maintenance MGM101-domain-containing protein n=1 Tax=Lipomyces arxii TaxID=56418 RepID=UPI0034D017B2